MNMIEIKNLYTFENVVLDGIEIIEKTLVYEKLDYIL